ncbi:MAG: hypothetical protein LBF08_07530 [Dysgonamonadaceae bacterium]|jgi:hypothetical protein|nr:hypothetical protein [Dysgonamonadaceae bacterium]
MKKVVLLFSVIALCCNVHSQSYERVLGSGTYNLTGSYDGGHFVVQKGAGRVTLNLRDFRVWNADDGDDVDYSCIDIEAGNQVTINLYGNNVLKAGGANEKEITFFTEYFVHEQLVVLPFLIPNHGGLPAIRVHPASEVFIHGPGRLEARGGGGAPGGSGIGGGWLYYYGASVPDYWEMDYLWNFEPVNEDPSSIEDLPEYCISTQFWHALPYDDMLRSSKSIPTKYTWVSQSYGACGKIHINGGTVNAYGGGLEAPGIGPSGFHTKGGEIVIQHGATVYAQGSTGAPGIGCTNVGYIPKIEISGGANVTSVGGGVGAPGIGGGSTSYIEEIRISDANVRAEGHIAIGVGENSKLNRLSIDGSDVVAESANQYPALGGLDASQVDDISLTNSKILAKNGIGNVGKVKSVVIGKLTIGGDRFINLFGGIGTSGLYHGRTFDYYYKGDPLFLNIKRSPYYKISLADYVNTYHLPQFNGTPETELVYEMSGGVSNASLSTYAVFKAPPEQNRGDIVAGGSLILENLLTDNSDNFKVFLGEREYREPLSGAAPIFTPGYNYTLFTELDDLGTAQPNNFGKVKIYKDGFLFLEEASRTTTNKFTYVYLNKMNEIEEDDEFGDVVAIKKNGKYGFSELNKSINVDESVIAEINLDGDIEARRPQHGALHLSPYSIIDLIIDGNTTINSMDNDIAIYVPETSVLRIKGSGDLLVNGSIEGGGIVIIEEVDIEVTEGINGNVTIESGIVHAAINSGNPVIINGGNIYERIDNVTDKYSTPLYPLTLSFSKGLPDNYSCFIRGKQYNLTGVQFDASKKLHVYLPGGKYEIGDISLDQYFINTERFTMPGTQEIDLTFNETFPFPTGLKEIYRSGDYLYNDNAEDISVYTLSGALIYKGKGNEIKLPKGAFIVRNSSGAVKKVAW